MIDRYTRPAMGRIWSEESKYAAWLRVELAVCEAWARRGRIPADAMARIASTVRVDIARILEIQLRVKHEMIALLPTLEEQLGADSRVVHIGLTTTDVWDTSLALPLRDAADLLIAGQERLRGALREVALNTAIEVPDLLADLLDDLQYRLEQCTQLGAEERSSSRRQHRWCAPRKHFGMDLGHAAHMRQARMVEIPSDWGHQSASAADAESASWLNRQIREFLEQACSD